MRPVNILSITARPKGDRLDLDLSVNAEFDRQLSGSDKLLIRAAAEKLIRLIGNAAAHQTGNPEPELVVSGWRIE